MNAYLTSKFHPVGTLPVSHPRRTRLRRLLLLVCSALGLNSCATTTETRYHADGSKSVIESTAPAIKDDTKRFAADLVWAFVPRQRPVHEAKVEEPAPKPKGKAKPKVEPSK